LTPLANTLAIDGEFLSCSVDAGYVVALPLHHGDLNLTVLEFRRRVTWRSCCYFGSMAIYGWEAYLWEKYLMIGRGGGVYTKGGVYAGHYSNCLSHLIEHSMFPMNTHHWLDNWGKP